MLRCALHLINQDTPLRNNQPRTRDAFFFITTPARIICDLLKWVTPLDYLPRRLGLFLWALLSVAAENVSNDFGFIRFEKGEIFWKKTKGTAEGTSKDLDNSVIKLPCANRLVILYPFVYIVLR